MKTAGIKPYSVFINCPFDDRYGDMFEALVFTVQDCGFIPRCSLEISDAGQIRIDKIARLISECRFGIHDISRTELDKKSKLPRFNMPLELGLFLGAKRFGNASQREKSCLILDRERYRYQQFCSDIAGQDISSHDGRLDALVTAVRNWLQTGRPDKQVIIPSGSIIHRRYLIFKKDLPLLCEGLRLRCSELVFADLTSLITRWLEKNNWVVRR